MNRFFGVFLSFLISVGAGGMARAQTYTSLSCGLPSPGITDTVPYTVPGTTRMRQLDIAIAEPTGLPAGVTLPLPAVIWSHGGATGGGIGNLADWRAATTEACYVSVTIGHTWPRKKVSKEVCEDVFELADPSFCGTQAGSVKMLSYLRPHDIAAVITHLENAYPGLVDPTKIVVGGHSGGAGGAMMVAGATRAFRSGDMNQDFIEVMDLSDTRPIAFIALSPQGPGVDGFFEGWKQGGETSWDAVDRPVYVGTGAGDNGCDQNPRSTSSSTIHFCSNLGPVPSNRKAVFDFLPAGAPGSENKYRYFIDDWRAAHTIFKLSNNTCVSGGGQTQDAQCALMFDGLKQTVSAFLDWHVRSDPLAEAFLADTPNIPGPPGLVSWDRK
ncbi:MAG: hypothetical protein AAFN94_06265 [Pseudomonadota bacterium]